jgi:type IV fimbrial biogenesis protein FimT
MQRPPFGLRGRGVTLVEMCVSLAIAALVVAQTLPSLKHFRERIQLRAAADALGDDLRLARAESVRLNRPVFFRISGEGAASCYLLHVGKHESCDCAGGKMRCEDDGAYALKAVWLPASQPVRLRSNVESMQFLRNRGSVTPTGSIDVHLNERESIRTVVAITGRVRACAPGAPIAPLRAC